ncbi:MAG: TlpA disulfide reductase family protein [Niabella sp.]
MKLFLHKNHLVGFLLFLCTLPCIAQIPFKPAVKVIFDAPYITELSVTRLGGLKKSYYNFIGQKPAKRGVAVDFPEVPKKGFYRINDGYFGHKVFISESDTATLILTRPGEIDAKMKKGEAVQKALRIRAKSKYPGNYTFFDDLEKIVGIATKWKSGSNESAVAFKIRVEERYGKSVDLLELYRSRKLISEDFVSYAQAEIKGDYIATLCECLGSIPRSNLPVNYFDRANTWKFDSEEYAETTQDYLQAANLYVYYIFNEYNTKEKGTGLISQYDAILKHYKGDIKNQLLSWLLTDYAKRERPEYESIYADAITKIDNRFIKYNTERKVAQIKKSKITVKTTNIEYADVLNNTYLTDIKGNDINLKKLLADSIPTIIDCWATWCGPCREQTPAMEEWEKQYKGKLNVLYISFDKDEDRWKNFITKEKKNASNQYLANNDFGSPFSAYFGIEAIPRYILISKAGVKVLNDKMPLPGLKDDFESELKKYLE